MGIKDNFTQAMKELTNPRPSDARKEVRDVASYHFRSTNVLKLYLDMYSTSAYTKAFFDIN